MFIPRVLPILLLLTSWGCAVSSPPDAPGPDEDGNYPPAFEGDAEVQPPEVMVTVDLGERGQLLAAPDQLLVGLRPAAWLADRQTVDAWLAERGIEVIGQIPLLKVLQVRLPVGAAMAETMDGLEALHAVAFATPNMMTGSRWADAPQGDSHPIPEGEYWKEAVGAERAWAETTGNAGFPIAIIDTGVAVDSGHFDGKTIDVIAAPGVTAIRAGTDEAGHGTPIAALAASPGGDNKGSEGLAWENPLIVVDVSDKVGGESSLEADLFGLNAAIQAGASVIALPRGPVLEDLGPCTATFNALAEYRWAMSPAMLAAREANALIIVAAGNTDKEATSCRGSIKNDDDTLPVYRMSERDYDTYLSAWRTHGLVVSALDGDRHPPEWGGEGEAIGLGAPGVEVTGAMPDGTFKLIDGTSMATGITAGAAALVFGVVGQDAGLVRHILQKSAKPLLDHNVGNGLLDVGNAIATAVVIRDQTLEGIQISNADYVFYGLEPGDGAGRVFGMGQLDNQGGTELGVGVPNYKDGGGIFYLFYGEEREPGVYSLNAAESQQTPQQAGAGLGFAATPLSDINGDAVADYAVSAPWFDPSTEDDGVVYVRLSDPLGQNESGAGQTIHTIHPINGDEPGGLFGYALSFAEVNGDTFSDLIVGAPAAYEGRGALYVIFGGEDIEKVHNANQADIILIGENPGDGLGTSLGWTGDLDSDGRFDLYVGAPGHDRSGDNAGKVYLVHLADLAGQRGESELVDIAAYGFLGAAPGDQLGEFVRMIGDVDRDGRYDMALGAPSNSDGGYHAGAVYVLLAASSNLWSDETPVAFSDFSLVGDIPGDGLGGAMAPLSDLNGDGADDWIIGAPQHESGFGASYIITQLDVGLCPHGTRVGDVGVKLVGSVVGDFLGSSLEGEIDFDGDYKLDLVIATPGAELTQTQDTGVISILRGPLTHIDESLTDGHSDNTAARMSCDSSPSGAAPWTFAWLLGVAVWARRRSRRIIPPARGSNLARLTHTSLGVALGLTLISCHTAPATPERSCAPSAVDEGIGGVVVDEWGHGIEGAEVRLIGYDDLPAAISDEDGNYILPLPADSLDQTLFVEASHPELTTNRRPLIVQEGQGGYSVRLPMARPEIGLLDPTQGGLVSFDRVRMVFPADALVYADAPDVRVTQLVEILMTPYFPGEHHELPVPTLEATSTGRLGRFASPAEGERALLATYGMIGVEMRSEDREVRVDSGFFVELEFLGMASRVLNPLNNNAPFQSGDTAPLYHLPDDEVYWELWNEAGWQVVEASDGTDSLSFIAEVPSFSYWNMDVRQPATKLVGQVFTQTAQQTVFWDGVEINIRGYNRSGGEWHTYGWTGNGGDYCIRVGADTADVEIWFEARFEGVLYKVREETSTQPVATEPSCDSPEASVHHHEIPCNWFIENSADAALNP